MYNDAMIIQFIYAFASICAISLVSFVGVFTLSIKDEIVKKYVFIFVSLAVGALLGDAFLHLMPEALETMTDSSLVYLSVILGIIIFFVIEKFLHWHHHQGIEDTHHDSPSAGKMILISDGIHNLIDGIIVGASYMISIEVGIATTIAVILHEIPQEIGDFGVLLHSGYTKNRALFLNFLSAIVSFVGLFTVFIIGESISSITIWFIPIAAGGFIYIALSDLVPELHKTSKTMSTIVQLLSILIGITSMILLLLLE